MTSSKGNNEAIAHIGNLLPSLVGARPKGRGSLVDQQLQKQSDLVEVAQEIPSLQPQLPAASLQPTLSKDSSKDPIWEIFRKQDEGTLKQDIQKLKATTKQECSSTETAERFARGVKEEVRREGKRAKIARFPDEGKPGSTCQ